MELCKFICYVVYGIWAYSMWLKWVESALEQSKRGDLGIPNIMPSSLLSLFIKCHFLQSGELFLPLAMHRQTAVLLVEVSTHHLHNKHMASLITDSVRQVASVVRSSVSPEQALCTWSWETALRLHLHALQQAHPVPASPTSGVIQGFDAPILSDDPKLHPILKSVQDKGALASYLALVMTKYGHT